MSSVNKCMLIGNLGADPELKYTQGGTAVANFTLATTESWTKDGEKQEKTEWHRVVVWQKLAEVAAKFLKKGSKAYVEGKVTYRSFENKDGQKVYMTEIVASDIRFLDSKEDAAKRGTGRGNEPKSEPDAGVDVQPDADPFA